jgi:hypothetical protein
MALARVVSRRLFEVAELHFEGPTFGGLHFLQALQVLQQVAFIWQARAVSRRRICARLARMRSPSVQTRPFRDPDVSLQRHQRLVEAGQGFGKGLRAELRSTC